MRAQRHRQGDGDERRRPLPAQHIRQRDARRAATSRRRHARQAHRRQADRTAHPPCAAALRAAAVRGRHVREQRGGVCHLRGHLRDTRAHLERGGAQTRVLGPGAHVQAPPRSSNDAGRQRTQVDHFAGLAGLRRRECDGRELDALLELDSAERADRGGRLLAPLCRQSGLGAAQAQGVPRRAVREVARSQLATPARRQERRRAAESGARAPRRQSAALARPLAQDGRLAQACRRHGRQRRRQQVGQQLRHRRLGPPHLQQDGGQRELLALARRRRLLARLQVGHARAPRPARRQCRVHEQDVRAHDARRRARQTGSSFLLLLRTLRKVKYLRFIVCLFVFSKSLKCQFIEDVLKILDSNMSSVDKPSAVKAYIVKSIKAMLNSTLYLPKVSNKNCWEFLKNILFCFVKLVLSCDV